MEVNSPGPPASGTGGVEGGGILRASCAGGGAGVAGTGGGAQAGGGGCGGTAGPPPNRAVKLPVSCREAFAAEPGIVAPGAVVRGETSWKAADISDRLTSGGGGGGVAAGNGPVARWGGIAGCSGFRLAGATASSQADSVVKSSTGSVTRNWVPSYVPASSTFARALIEGCEPESLAGLGS